MRVLLALWVVLLPLAWPSPLLPSAKLPSSSLQAAPPGGPISPTALDMQNPNMECEAGFAPQIGIGGTIPEGWTGVLLSGNPEINSTRYHFTWRCDHDGWVERLEGWDSWAFFSQDIETPPLPGKPFDAALYQQVPVTPNTVYSLSGWMVSFCGGSFSNPNDCPPGYYIVKMLGLDPDGGTNPLAPGVLWGQNSANFTAERWVNLRVGASARSSKMTVFVRVNSPFQHHGNHALADAVSLLKGPTAQFVDLPANSVSPFEVRWTGILGPDIPLIPSSTHRLYFDVQYRIDGGDWHDWITHQESGSAMFSPPAGAVLVDFRVRPLAEQPDGSGGSWPNHRYLGVWTDPHTVVVRPNHPPVAVPDEATTDEDVALAISVLANDTDMDAEDQLSVISVSTPAHGTTTPNGTNVLYTPAHNYNGGDSFTYVVSDGLAESSANVSVTIQAVNDAPQILGPGARFYEKCQAVSFAVYVVDPEDDPLTYRASNLPTELTIDPVTGRIEGTLSCAETVTHQITVYASDGELESQSTFPLFVVDNVASLYLPLVQR